MQVIEIYSDQPLLTLRQRWADVFTVLTAVILLIFGFNLRNQSIYAAAQFESPEAGIIAWYPQNWLIDTDGDYVFRVRDMSKSSFKTSFQVRVLAIGQDAVERNVADRLTLDRIRAFTAYRVLSQEPYISAEDWSGEAISYVYVSSDASPFLEGVPTVVRGLDIIVIRGSQAIIISYRADATAYDEELARFERFVRRLTF